MSSPTSPGGHPAPAGRDQQVIRVFLSSTFRDFMQERDLLVKQVFPSLRRRAQERGVEVVDVDLRWGITEEESQQGKVIGICLAEIERCRPYFIGMLGERYGWTPQPSDYPEELFEREQLEWIRDHQGGASVTELEIMHGVLNDREMAGRAFFYFRDPAWSRAQNQLGFVSDTEEEKQKLADLKERIRGSGFLVAENLADPQVIADQIEADLWTLIEEFYPDLDQADALEREARKHASYRGSRVGVYLGGDDYIQQLEEWIQAGEKKILITGESGAGKSALIANWVAAHGLAHPEDVIYCHHLGCSNDANAIRPLLARMLDTASRLLLEHDLISEAIQVPQDWWELTAKVVGTLQDLGRWCRTTGQRWIWVLDGLDRLDAEDQQALPWLPLLIPEGVSVVISALECQTRTILEERQFRTLTIGPLQRPEQDALIERYLERYTKKLEPERRQQILNCELARSPLFLKVLLEELRQCGRFETLKDQIEAYIKPNADGSLAVSDLYERVLERLESDCGVEVVRKVMTVLWASRAGLSESELRGITELAPLQWAPIDLALEQALGRNGNRLDFDHEYLRNAVLDRYLSEKEKQHHAHSHLANWFDIPVDWDNRKAQELPWQLQQAGRLADLRGLLLNVRQLYALALARDSREVINYWIASKEDSDFELDEQIGSAVESEIENWRGSADEKISFLRLIADLLNEAGLYREMLLELRRMELRLEEQSDECHEERIFNVLRQLADAYRLAGNHEEALKLYASTIEEQKRALGDQHLATLGTISCLGNLHRRMGNYSESEFCFNHCLLNYEQLLGSEHPDFLATLDSLGLLYGLMGYYERSEFMHKTCLETKKRILGLSHQSTLISQGNLGNIYWYMGLYPRSWDCLSAALHGFEMLLGPDHPDTLTANNNLGNYYLEINLMKEAEDHYTRSLVGRERKLGSRHPQTLSSVECLATLYYQTSSFSKSEELYKRVLSARELALGHEHPDTLQTLGNLGNIYLTIGNLEQSFECFRRCVDSCERVHGAEHPQTLTALGRLAQLYRYTRDYVQSEAYYIRALEGQKRVLGPKHRHTLATMNNLGLLYKTTSQYERSEDCFLKVLEGHQQSMGPEHPDTLVSLGNLGDLYMEKGDYEKAESIFRNCLEVQGRVVGREHANTLTTLNNLGSVYYYLGNINMAEDCMVKAIRGRESLFGNDHPETLVSACNLAAVYSSQRRYLDAIPLRRRELAWCREQNCDTDPGTLTSINALAIDLREAGELEEAEALFRELLASRQKILEPSDFGIGRAFGGLAQTLELAGRLEDAAAYRQQALEHRIKHEGPDAWWTNRNRFDLARILQKLERFDQSTALLDELQTSIAGIEDPDQEDQELLAEAAELRASIQVDGNGEND